MSARDIFDELVAGKWPTVQEWIRTEHAESLHLEFKSRDEAVRPDDELTSQDKDDIARTISGFANVEGGVLVIGLRTNNSRGNRDPDKLDPTSTRQEVAYLPDAEAFARALRGPRLRALTDPPIGIRDVASIIDPSDDKRGGVVVLVPDSEAKPHRTARGLSSTRAERYYERSHTTTDVMSHSMLSALFGLRPPTVLRLVVKRMGVNQTPRGPLINIHATMRNIGRGTAENAAAAFDPSVVGAARINHHSMRATAVTSMGNRLIALPRSPDLMHPGWEDYLCSLEVQEDAARVTVRIEATLCATNMQPLHIDEEVTLAEEGDTVVLPTTVPQGPQG